MIGALEVIPLAVVVRCLVKEFFPLKLFFPLHFLINFLFLHNTLLRNGVMMVLWRLNDLAWLLGTLADKQSD